MRRLRNGTGLHVIETEYRPECVNAPVGSRVVFEAGRTGIHEGHGWVRIYGDGEQYGFKA